MQILPLWKIQTVKPMEAKTFTVTVENAGNRLDKLLAEQKEMQAQLAKVAEMR